MNRDSIIDLLSCILFRLSAAIIRRMPLDISFALGRGLGNLFYYFDVKHKAIAYSNIKAAEGAKLSPAEISRLTRRFYENFGQNFIELFLIPLFDKEYLDKYISIEGRDNIAEGFKRGKGVIFLGVHEGSWELSSVISANLGFRFNLFIRQQSKYPRLNNLLNAYRRHKGGRLIQRQNQTRQLIEALKNNEAVGMTLDQGGKDGTHIKFFGKDASWASGAIRLALRYDAAIIPSFYIRLDGPRIRVIVSAPFKIKKTGNDKVDVRENLQELVQLFEKHILSHPEEYLWSYKIWKYAQEKNILILSDGKIGHLRQAQALAKIIGAHYKDKGINTHIDTREIKFKNKFSRFALALSSCLSGKYHCQGCLWCLRRFLPEDIYKSLLSQKPDIVVSCGSSLAPVNFIISRENLAKSIAIMRPSVLSMKRFSLVVMPRHDKPRKRRNVAITAGALNLIDKNYLEEQAKKLLEASSFSRNLSDFCIGLLIGGDTKDFHLRDDAVSEVIKGIKSASEKLQADILVTTSRRTSRKVEEIVKGGFKDYPRCKLLVIANEKNLPSAVGGILALSEIVLVSAESISMICEAASSGRYVVVFKSKVSRRHNRFLNYMAKSRYIYLCKPLEIASVLNMIWQERPAIDALKDRIIVGDALKSIL